MAWWQTLALEIDPVAFEIAGIPVPWYTLAYVLGIFLATLFFVSLARRRGLFMTEDATIELLVSVLWGVIIGARLGYVILYGDESYWREPWRIISPYDFTLGEWVGIRGLSFHGGLIGGAYGLWRFSREAGRNFWQFADCLAQAVPLALLTGRIGNFLNQELIGRVTSVPWGMQLVSGEGLLRHPVTLYEALGEGVLLFFFLLLANRLGARPGTITALFLIGYGAIRFMLEFFRETELIMTLGLSLGQALSVAMVLGGALVLFSRARSAV